ncbi:MAG: VCBS repeat-containing protein [Planctomycetes bacterium]|nr:VCBS repeat-containing protein [Planctomycetota bacterium]
MSSPFDRPFEHLADCPFGQPFVASAKRALCALLAGAAVACSDPSAPPEPRGDASAAGVGAPDQDALAAGSEHGSSVTRARSGSPPTDDAPASTDPPRFATRREFAVGAKPESVAAADFDGDGRAELVAAVADPGELVVRRGSRHGLEEAATRITIDPWPLAPLVVPAGLFGASRPRLALVSRRTRTLEFVDPLSGERTPFVTLPEVPRAFALGAPARDVREDRATPETRAERAELVFACDGRTLCVVDESRRLVRSALPHALPRCVTVLADAPTHDASHRESRTAVVIGFQDSASLVVLARGTSEPRGEFVFEREIALPGFPRELTELDVDRDGDLELVVLGGDRAAWVFGFGAPGGAAAWRVAEPERLEWNTSSVPLELAHGDFDLDGAADLAVLAFADLEVSVWNDFERSGPKVASFGYVGQSALSLAAADFDGDRVLDLAIANRDATCASVVRGLARGEFEFPTLVDVATFPNSIASGDLDGDGRAEAVTVSAKVNELNVVRIRDERVERTTRLPIGPSAKALVLADLDRDTHVDAAWIASDAHGAEIELAFGDGTGAFAPRVDEPPLAIGASGDDLLALDLDGDGTIELVAANAEANELCVFSRGERGFAPAPVRLACAAAPVALAASAAASAPRESGAAPTSAPAPAPALAVALAGPGPRTGVARIELARTPNGKWSLVEREFVGLRGVPLDVAFARLDAASSKLDERALVVLGADSRDAANGWLRVVRGGAIAEQHVPGLKSSRLAVGDVDQDGHDDVLVASLNAHTVNLWLARAGKLVAQPSLGAGLGVLDVALGDADGDGRPDVFACDAFGDDVALLRNVAAH